MKILLLNPQPESDVVISRDHMGGFGFEIKSTNMIPPLSLAYCAAVIEALGLEVDILDAVALRRKPKNVLALIGERSYDLVALNTATPSIADDLKMARRIKQTNPAGFVVLLGPHVSLFAEEALAESEADAVVRGEPEYTVEELASTLAQGNPPDGILGLSIRADSTVTHFDDRPLVENLDSIPFPARHLLPMEKYRSAVWGKQPFTTMLTSRGCSYGCIYCPYRIGHGTKWRARSPGNVVEEIEECVGRFGVREILFRDPLFTADQQRAVAICEQILARGIQVDWRCETRADLLSEDLITLFARAGCKGINVGIESGAREILETVRRFPIAPERIRSVFEKCRRVGIETMAFFIIGLPGETKETARRTVEFAVEVSPDVVQFTAATPYPHTPYYEQLKQEGLLVDDWSLYTSRAPVIGTKELDPEQLQALIADAYRTFYFRPAYIMMRLRKLKSVHEIKRTLRGLFSVLRYARISR
jgi:radical SAM superfamily enzyme YgiQ (UPF0313 family)